jgi:3,4-dihydroxy 2-butanone 4-phosphate synthase / GTP cyclohydrolase II
MTRGRVEDALDAVARGDLVIVQDASERENEGDLIMAAEKATPAAVAFMIRYTSGLVCAPLTSERLDALGLPLMVPANTEAHRTAFTISVDAAQGTTTGISAADRATTIQALVDPATRPDDLARPGHVFPLRASGGGVLTRPGHTEAAVDLARLAGLVPAGVVAEITNEDGTMARTADLERFAEQHHLVLISVADLIAYRLRGGAQVRHVAEARLPTTVGMFKAHVFAAEADGIQHLALVHGDPARSEAPLVRVHSECLTGDVLGSCRCDCGAQLQASLEAVARACDGVVLYLRDHEGRGIGLGPKLRAYALQDQGRDTVDANLELGYPADRRDYHVAAAILSELGVRRLRLLTNNPAKCAALAADGLQVLERIPLLTPPTPDNVSYLWTKQTRLGHLLELV